MSEQQKPRTQAAPAQPQRVTLRALYSSAMQEVMADPGKAIAEHDPFLADLMTNLDRSPSPES